MKPLRLALAAALLAACGSVPQPKPAPLAAPVDPAQVAAAKAAVAPVVDKAKEAALLALSKMPAVDEAAIDKGVKPCDDFYQYACGAWLKSTPIPADRAVWGRGFSEIAQRNEEVVKGILEEAARGAADPANPDGKKLGDFYATCMDEPKAETASLAALKKALQEIDGVKDGKGLARQVAKLHLNGVGALFAFASEQDAKDATKVIGKADQGGMGLPDKDYYTDPKFAGIKGAYAAWAEAAFGLLGKKPAEAKKLAAAAIAVEQQLSDKSLRRVERRDPKALYNRLERKGLADSAKGFAWDAYFEGAGLKDVQAINVAVPAYFTGLGAVVGDKKKLEALKTYLKWRLVAASSSALGAKFVDEQFKFTQKLSGAKALLPRWKRCVAQAEGLLGEMVGRTYVTKAFSGASKPIAQGMIAAILKAFEKNLDTLAWMDAETRAGSVKKLATMVSKIGYPDRWLDTSAMAIGTSSLLENRWAAASFEKKRDLAKIDKPLDRAEWSMPPALVNAGYEPALNDITFPAGILQYPFFKETQHPAGNFGGVGMGMGHEITHGFDDEGSQYDAEGNLKNWWSEKSRAEYDKRTACVVEQYNAYPAVEDENGRVNHDGKLTLGENIADIGGLKLTLRAWQQTRPAPHTVPGGFTDEQALFIAFAQTWCTNMRPEAARQQAKTNEHSLARARVNVPVMDTPEFAAAFSCAEGSPMAPKNRCEVW